MCRFPLFAVAFLAACFPHLAAGQSESEFYATPKTAPEYWRAAQFELRTGSFERAAERIKGLLDLNPDDKTLFDLVDKPPPGTPGGMAQFLRLRNVPAWHPREGPNKEAKQRVEELIGKITKALEAELGNPERIRRYANALAGLPEESAFALNELRRSGKAVPGVLVTMLGEELSEAGRASILDAIPQLGQDTVPGFVAFLPVAPAPVQVELIDALRARGDFKGLDVTAETDPVPTLWYLAGRKDSPDLVKSKARDAIFAATGQDASLERDPALRTSEGQLTAYARKFADGKSNLQVLVGDAKHMVWLVEGQTLKETPMTQAEATEYYGLRYARWALDIHPQYLPALKAFLTVAIDYHAITGGGRPLARTAPDLQAALLTAPLPLLTELLEEALRDRRTPVVLAIVRVLGERTEKIGPIPLDGKAVEQPAAKDTVRPSLLVRALDYPDPRVQFVATDAILRMPGAPRHNRNYQIVNILAAALAADPEDGARQKALLVDPDPIRADGLASVLKRSGFDVEVVRTGRQMMKRIQEKADMDLVLVDRHVADPMLVDLLPQYKADYRARNLPLLVIASPEGATPVNLLTALARLACTVSFEDLPQNPFLTLPEFEPGAKREDIVEKVRYGFDEMRALVLARHTAQVEKMIAVVQKAGFAITDEMRARLEYFSIQTFPPEIVNTFASSLLDQERILLRELLPQALRDDPSGYSVAALKGKIRSDGLPSREQADRILNLMRLTNTLEAELPADRLPAFQAMWNSFWDPDLPRLPPMDPVRNPEVEARVSRVVAPYKNVFVAPAVFSDLAFRTRFAQASDPKVPMVSPEEKKANARAALVWLRKMAVGEIPGYKIDHAEKALRGALNSDDLAPLALDALVRLPGQEVQRDLANLAVAPGRPVPIRTQAAEALVQHLQSSGRFVTEPQVEAIANAAAAEADEKLRARLLAAHGVLKSDLKATGDRLRGYAPKPVPAEKEEVPPPKEKE